MRDPTAAMGSKTSLAIRQHLSMMLLYTIFQGLAIYPIITLAADVRHHSASSRGSPYGSSHGNSDSHVHPAFSNFVAHGHQKRAEGNCSGFPGDQDTYGLGIRIGLYFQWVTSSIAYNLVPSEAINMRGVNNCFQLAMFAGLLYVTITKGSLHQLHPVEAYIMLLFCMGGVCSGTSDVGDGVGDHESSIGIAARKSYAYLEASSLGGCVRVLLGCGFIGYGLWFLFLGMDDMRSPFPNDCNYAFFLARVDLFGWFRTLLRVLFVCASIPAVISFVFMMMSFVNAASVFLLQGGWQGRVKPHKHSAGIRNSPSGGENVASPKGKQSALSEGEVSGGEKPRFSEGETAPSEAEGIESSGYENPGLQNIKLRKQNVGFSGALLLFIISVELIIRWNKIEGVGAIGSTGQLLPVIIGVGGVGRVVIRLIQDFLEEVALNRLGSGGVQVEDHPKPSLASTQPPEGTGNSFNGAPNPFVHDIEGLAFTSR